MRDWADNALFALGPGFNIKDANTGREDTANALRQLMPKLLGFGIDARTLGGDIQKSVFSIRKMIIAYHNVTVAQDKPVNLSKLIMNMVIWLRPITGGNSI